MNILFLYHMLRSTGLDFIRSRYFLNDLERRGHIVRLAYFIDEDKEKWMKLNNDVISFDEVSEFRPDVLIFELGSADRFPNRNWLNEIKRKGCIVLHCGLGYNDYDQHRSLFDEMYAGFGCEILKKKNDLQNTDELPNIRGSGASQIARTDVETLKRYCAIRDANVFKDILWVESHHALIIKPRSDLSTWLGYNILLTAGPKSSIKAYNDWDIHGENNAVYGVFNDNNGIEILITGHFVTDGRDETDGQYNRTFLINVLEYLHLQNPIRYKTESGQTNHASAEWKTKLLREETMDHIYPTEQRKSAKSTSILFLAADPTDASRLRLGEEFREIQEKLKSARLRDQFKLELPQLSVRPPDISQALLDTQPQIVHFSGHGTSSGSLCFENQTGQIQFVQPEALAALFEQFSNQVKCVLLNACYSKIQAEAIAKNIRYVIGMNQEIGDKAAIAFAIGFYQALGAGRTIEEAYKLGCIQIQLQNIPEHLTPELIINTNQPNTEIIYDPSPSNPVSLVTFCINPAKCKYKEYFFDPDKPYWPSEDNGGVTYHGGDGGITVYGKHFQSWDEANEYKSELERTRNHRSFDKDTIHKIYFERMDDKKGPNYPNFYFSISNNTNSHIILNAIEAKVIGVQPLMSVGVSHALPSEITYQMKIDAGKGISRMSLVPSLKVEAGDAVAFDLYLIPNVSKTGGYAWLLKFILHYSGNGIIETEYFEIIM